VEPFVFSTRQAFRRQKTLPRSKRASFVVTSLFLAVALLGLDTTGVLGGDIYKWRDEKGQLHFTDSEYNIPPEYREEATKKTYEDEPSSTYEPSSNQSNSATSSKKANTPTDGEVIDIPFIDKEGSADRIIINMVFNNRVTAPILVDTGSPGLVLSAKLASQLGIINEDSNNLVVTIGGIGGKEVAIRTIIDKVRIGAITEEFIPAHIIFETPKAYQGLVGMDILANYTVTIDSANKRLIAKRNPENAEMPAGHGQSWWQRNFREFNFYSNFWESQLTAVNKLNGPYSGLPSGKRNDYKEFIEAQSKEAKDLLMKLDRYASWRGVPRHWRR